MKSTSYLYATNNAAKRNANYLAGGVTFTHVLQLLCTLFFVYARKSEINRILIRFR